MNFAYDALDYNLPPTKEEVHEIVLLKKNGKSTTDAHWARWDPVSQMFYILKCEFFLIDWQHSVCLKSVQSIKGLFLKFHLIYLLRSSFSL